MAFVNQVAALAEAEDHHPDIAIHWNRVTLRWWTHANAITERDHSWPRAPTTWLLGTRPGV